jgi:hypothetical protein
MFANLTSRHLGISRPEIPEELSHSSEVVSSSSEF